MLFGSGVKARRGLCFYAMKDSCTSISFLFACVEILMVWRRGALGAWIKNIDEDKAEYEKIDKMELNATVDPPPLVGLPLSDALLETLTLVNGVHHSTGTDDVNGVDTPHASHPDINGNQR